MRCLHLKFPCIFAMRDQKTILLGIEEQFTHVEIVGHKMNGKRNVTFCC